MELIRFFGVSVVGVLIDLSIAYFLAALVGVPLWAAASLGLLVAAVINYVIHEIWTFRQGTRALSIIRSVKYLVVSVVTLLSRVVIVIPMEKLFPNSTLLILIGAAGVSFLINFALSKIFVFSISNNNTEINP